MARHLAVTGLGGRMLAGALLACLSLAPAAIGAARAATISGSAALALGAIVGQHDPLLSSQRKSALLRLLADGPVPPSKAGGITVKADAITCQAGDVDIAAFACTLGIGSRHVALSGRDAHELFATLLEAGVQGDGAAGRIFAAVKMLSCRIDPAGLSHHDGSGADCDYQPGP